VEIHCHNPDPVQVKVRMAEEESLEAVAKHLRLSTGHLINQWQKATAVPTEKGLVSSKRTMQRRVKKIKQEANGFPPVPKDWDDLAEFPDKFSKTYDNN
jgi:hypothetical protein